MNPLTNLPVGESHKPIVFYVSDALTDHAIIGMPLLNNAMISFPNREVHLNLGRRQLRVPFCTMTTYMTLPTENKLDISSRTQNEKSTETSHTADFHLSAVKINKQLPQKYKDIIFAIIHRHKDCFQRHPEEVGYFKNGQHPPLRLTTSSNVYTQPKAYPLAKALHSQFNKQLQQWLDQGVVVKQDRVVEFRGNFVPVKKKDGTFRFAFDSRNLNSILNNENAVIPSIMEVLGRAGGFKYYTTLDVSNFFLLFKLDRDSQDMLTFASPVTKQLYKFTRTMFGVKNVMSNATLLLSNELDKLTDRSELLAEYVDDLTLFHNDLDKLLKDLERLLKVLQDANIKLKPSNVHIAFTQCDLFGYRLDSKGYTITPDRKTSILKVQRPKNRKQLLSFLGKASYFRTILQIKPGMGYFMSKFRDLTSEKTKFKWNNTHDALWEQLMQSFQNAITLRSVLPSDDHMVVRSDASNTNMGATLSTIRHGEEFLINTLSKCWTSAVSNYHITRLELIAALLALAAFKGDLLGRRVDLYVDNAATFYTLKFPQRVSVYGTLIPRLLYDVRFINFKVHKTDNNDNNWALVDALSRATGQIVIKARNVKQLLEIEDDPNPEDCVKLVHAYPINVDIGTLTVHTPLTVFNKFKKTLAANTRR